MTLIRSLIFFLFFLTNTILIASIGSLIGWFLSTKQRFIIDSTWSRLNLWGLKIICGLDYRLEGQENLPDQTCIILCKHQSAWETIALIYLIPYPKAWVLKRELLYVPIFGWVMYHFKPIAINRKSGRRAVKQIIEQGIQRLRSGLSVIIFPEGTRVAPGTRKRYGIGGALLAEKSGFPILPVAHNAGIFWKRRGILKYPGTIDVRIGPLIQSDGLKAVEINQKVEEWIEGVVAELPSSRTSDDS
ncbi:MAG: lysophospholipid acyltransferase family protein [Gammaproteobacteria bacterium]|nr:lysophospholipid acyltransferase family protein [Gammaproteobacteria bacterium]